MLNMHVPVDAIHAHLSTQNQQNIMVQSDCGYSHCMLVICIIRIHTRCHYCWYMHACDIHGAHSYCQNLVVQVYRVMVALTGSYLYYCDMHHTSSCYDRISWQKSIETSQHKHVDTCFRCDTCTLAEHHSTSRAGRCHTSTLMHVSWHKLDICINHTQGYSRGGPISYGYRGSSVSKRGNKLVGAKEIKWWW